MILITGASGNAGSAVMQSALAAGLPLRAMYRNKADTSKAPQAVETVIADFADKTSLENALAGIESVYLVCAPVPQLVELEGNVIDEAKKAGVRHIVLNSALGAGDFPKSFPSWHFQVEQNLQSSGIAYTILRPNGFMQNIVSYNASSVRTEDAFYAALGDAKISLIDVRDVGAVAAEALREPHRHAGKVYELNGPEAISNAEVAERLSGVAGRKISYVDIPEEAQRKAMLEMGMPEWLVKAILELQEYYRSGQCAALDSTVSKLIGRPERTLDAFLRENAASFQRQAASV